ncbi:hypothetical protein [Acrocarpospora catenulata]|uniref:hypothetical protein n=1 Tax=Acrocarpospora catenulata TaxID=2836182 RepID=UPI001BDB618D|nr:hypothetical protein [Acrocarpospora catenulata]
MADVIEQRPSRRRRWIGVAVLLLAVAVPVGSMLFSESPAPPPPAPSPTFEPAPALSTFLPKPNVVHPAETGGKTRTIHVTFPDGSRARVSYPQELDLAGLGLRPYASVVLGTAFRELVAPYQGAAEVAAGGPMIRELAEGVTLWPRQVGSGGQVMLYAFGDWQITLRDQPDPLSYEDRRTLAHGLHGTVTKDGFLTYTADEPVRLMAAGQVLAGQPVGPQLWFGGGTGPLLVLAPSPSCDSVGQAVPLILLRTGAFGTRCRDGFMIAASGRQSFVDRAVEGIRIRPE